MCEFLDCVMSSKKQKRSNLLGKKKKDNSVHRCHTFVLSGLLPEKWVSEPTLVYTASSFGL